MKRRLSRKIRIDVNICQGSLSLCSVISVPIHIYVHSISVLLNLVLIDPIPSLNII